MGRDSKFGALVLILVLGFLVAAGGAALAEGAEPNEYINESVTVDYSNDSTVDETGVEYRNQVTVYAEDGTELERGTDYEWDVAVGNVSWFNTSATTEGETASITYTVEQIRSTSDKLAQIAGILVLPLALLVTLLLGAGPLKAVVS
jgi:hypothetical protein